MAFWLAAGKYAVKKSQRHEKQLEESQKQQQPTTTQAATAMRWNALFGVGLVG